MSFIVVRCFPSTHLSKPTSLLFLLGSFCHHCKAQTSGVSNFILKFNLDIFFQGITNIFSLIIKRILKNFTGTDWNWIIGILIIFIGIFCKNLLSFSIRNSLGFSSKIEGVITWSEFRFRLKSNRN